MAVLHITNGDCAAEPLRTFVDGDVVCACDVLHEGPAPADADGAAWHTVRAKFLAGGDERFEARVRREMAETDGAIERAAGGGEVVLWFEHDLFDQLALIRTLSLLDKVRLKPDATSGGSTDPVESAFRRTSVMLICIGEFPGVEPFFGLGQLTAEQLATLWPRRTPVSDAQLELASEAWRAFREPDPSSLFTLMKRRLQPAPATGGRSALPFLPGALHRFFEEYPSMHNGLPRTEQAALRVLANGGLTARELFRRSQRFEERPFLGDLVFFDTLDRLARGAHPLVSLTHRDNADGADPGAVRVALTDAGRDVYAGRADAIALNGIDRWRGGVHLLGAAESPWRWDAARQSLVSWDEPR